MSQKFNFPARLRIKSKKDIERLFENDASFFAHPLLLKYYIEETISDSTQEPQFAVSIPKRNFRRAHDRNLLKRRIREAYRLQWRQILNETYSSKILLMFIYVGKQINEFDDLHKAVENLLLKIKKSLVSSEETS